MEKGFKLFEMEMVQQELGALYQAHSPHWDDEKWVRDSPLTSPLRLRVGTFLFPVMHMYRYSLKMICPMPRHATNLLMM